MNDPDPYRDRQRPPASDDTRRIAGWMLALMWLCIVGLAAVFAQQWIDRQAKAREARQEFDEFGQQSLILRADRYGQFAASGQINQRPVTFLLDTGASGVSIPQPLAQSLALERGRPFQVLTANGTVTVYGTMLSSLQLGPFIRYEQAAHINPAMTGDIVLLGMSFLRHYELLQSQGELTLRLPRPE